MCRLSPEVEENDLCILSKLQQFRIMNTTAVMLLRFLNHLPRYSGSFDLANLCAHTVIIIFIRMTGRESTTRGKVARILQFGQAIYQ